MIQGERKVQAANGSPLVLQTDTADSHLHNGYHSHVRRHVLDCFMGMGAGH